MIRFGDLIYPDAYIRPQFSEAEEARQDEEQRWAERFHLADLEPDSDPYLEETA